MRWLEDRKRGLEAMLFVPVVAKFVQLKDKNQPVGVQGCSTVKSKSAVVKWVTVG